MGHHSASAPLCRWCCRMSPAHLTIKHTHSHTYKANHNAAHRRHIHTIFAEDISLMISEHGTCTHAHTRTHTPEVGQNRCQDKANWNDSVSMETAEKIITHILSVFVYALVWVINLPQEPQWPQSSWGHLDLFKVPAWHEGRWLSELKTWIILSLINFGTYWLTHWLSESVHYSLTHGLPYSLKSLPYLLT